MARPKNPAPVGETYGSWLRSQPLDKLTKDERDFIRSERKWEQENPGQVAALDAMIGQDAMLVRDYESVSGVRTWAAGTMLHVESRAGQYLLARVTYASNFVLSVRLEWIRPAVRLRGDADDQPEAS